MFEKVNPAHPDKVADRIAGALVDLAYQKENVLIGLTQPHTKSCKSPQYWTTEVIQ